MTDRIQNVDLGIQYAVPFVVLLVAAAVYSFFTLFKGLGEDSTGYRRVKDPSPFRVENTATTNLEKL